MAEYTREALQKTGIHDLRTILRNLGGTPGDMNKEQMIANILGIQDGTLILKPKKKGGRGRPPLVQINEEVPDDSNETHIETSEKKPQEIDNQEVEIQAVEKPLTEIVSDESKDAVLDEKESIIGNSNTSASENNVNRVDNNTNRDNRQTRQFSSNKNQQRNTQVNGKNIYVRDKKQQTVVSDKVPSYSDEQVTGVLELHADGYGFLRAKNYEPTTRDIFVARPVVKQYGLRRGDKIVGYCQKLRENESPALKDVVSINGEDVNSSVARNRKNFDDLIPYYPTERIVLEDPTREDNLAIRCMDLLCPVGKGQRGLIVSPPKAGKTTLLKHIAQSIEKNYPKIHLIVLLIDERPEEVTDLQRSVHGEVVYSTFDESPEHHIRAAELVMWRAKRLVEMDKDVVILLDSITRLTRAYNNTVPSSGKILSGGIDPVALPQPKKFFGAARNIENGGSLTILSSALVDTGSKMDDVIYEEFKGTGNMEIHLSRELSEKRIFPAIDLYTSGTRKDELLLSKEELDCAYKIRKILSREDASENLLEMMKKTRDNAEFVRKMDTWVKLYLGKN